jgi:predicted metalloenzyme YecM
MSSVAVSTLVEMLEKLPVSLQDNILDHVSVYLEELEREQHWEATFLRFQGSISK